MAWIEVDGGKPITGRVVWARVERPDLEQPYVTLAEWDGCDFAVMQPAYEYNLEDYSVERFGAKVTHWMPVDRPECDLPDEVPGLPDITPALDKLTIRK